MAERKIKKILVPLDGSKNSTRGLDEAIYLAGLCQATITGLGIIITQPTLASVVTKYQDYQKKQTEKYLSSAETRAKQKNITFTSKIITGGPAASKITDYAKKEKFDLIVIGSRGQSRAKEIFLGSVANGIAHKSRIPLLIVK